MDPVGATVSWLVDQFVSCWQQATDNYNEGLIEKWREKHPGEYQTCGSCMRSKPLCICGAFHPGSGEPKE